jgi:hypothetical protein
MTDEQVRPSETDEWSKGHISPRNGKRHNGLWEKCAWCGPPARETERESAKKFQLATARTFLDYGKTVHSSDYIVMPELWDKAVKRLERRDRSDPAGLLEALLADLGIPYIRVQP